MVPSLLCNNQIKLLKMKNVKILLGTIILFSVFAISCQKAANPNFTYSQNGLGAVNFTNTSSNASSYTWSFGDGSGSTQTSPSHTYSSTGTYTVTLTANGSGGSGTNSQSISVQ